MFTNQRTLLVRADAGPDVGTGHVMRMLALAQAWKRMGGNVHFVCGEIPSGLVKRIEAERVQVIRISNHAGDRHDAEETRLVVASLNPEWIALDGYQFDDAYQQNLKSCGTRMMVMDDYNHATHQHSDLIVNQNCYADPRLYANKTSAHLLTGQKYVLMREEFAHLKAARSPTKPISRDVRRVLVTFGGADQDNWTLKTLQALSDLKQKRLTVECVIGACYQHWAELESFRKTVPLNLRIHQNVEHMSALMSRVDLAITAGGSTCYELARSGVPSIVAAIAPNQEPVAHAMHHNGAMISIDESGAATAGKSPEHTSRELRLVKAIGCLMESLEVRQNVSQQGMKLVDGQGSTRVAHAMAAALYPFRRATLDDAEIMWHWRNDPEVRAISFNKQIIPFEHHQAWLKQRLGNAQTTLWIVEDQEGSAVGQVRFELDVEYQSALISIIIDQTRRGRGLGTILIAAACNELFKRTETRRVVAQIKPSNAASEKAFRAAGFRAIEPAIVSGKMALQFVFERDTQEPPQSSNLRKSA